MRLNAMTCDRRLDPVAEWPGAGRPAQGRTAEPDWMRLLAGLAMIEQRNDGILDADALGRRAYRRLLAVTLASTLDDAVKSVVGRATEAQLNGALLATASLTGLMIAHNINLILTRDGIFSSRETIGEMSGLTR